MAHNTIDVPQLVRAERQERVKDRQMQHRTLYTPPLDGSLDPHREFDNWVSQQVIGMLDDKKAYPGWGWNAKCRAEQGIVYFNIPVLMGDTLNWLIKLHQWEDLMYGGKRMVLHGGGELLERMDLPRGPFDEAAFERAYRNPHLFDFGDSLKKKLA